MSLYTNPRTMKVKVGLCEVCDNPVESDVYLMHNSILMCEAHRDEELRVMASAPQVIQTAREIDESVESVGDLLGAQTVGLIELHAAIFQDESIPADKKQSAYSDEIQRRTRIFKRATFGIRKLLSSMEAATRVLQVNGQESVALLREAERAKYVEFDLTYQPTTPKSVKPGKDKVIKPSKPARGKILMRDANEAGEKYDLPGKAIQAYGEANNLSAVDAAYKLAQMTGKLPSANSAN